MTKKFSILRYIAVITLVTGLFTVTGCDNDDGPPVYNGTVLELIKSDQFKETTTGSADNALDSLVKYLSLYADLEAALSGSAEVTFFAPSNTAFKNLLATPGFPSNISLISPDLIKGVLSYHIVDGKKAKGDLTAAATFDTKYTDASTSTVQKIEVNPDLTLKTGSINANIDVVVADQFANNGVVHVVESVMIPPSVGASLTPILGTIAGSVLLGKDFTLMARLIARADAGITDPTQRFVALLARPVGTGFTGATFFAVPNVVFEGAAAGGSATAFVDTFTTGASGTARAVLLNHYVNGRYAITATGTGVTKIENGTMMQPLSGATKTITAVANPASPTGIVVSNTPAVATSFKAIAVKDVAHLNGYIQVLGGILQ
jgi:uncharacterized surface protein with fasciclin (FAS1) repeats